MLSLVQLRHQVKVAQVTSSALAITVEAKTATIAQAAANAVANSYVQFVKSKGQPRRPGEGAAGVPAGIDVLRDAGDGGDGVGKGR